MSINIALTGPIYSGKTTLAEELQENHGFVVAYFSDMLKEYTMYALNACGAYVTVDEVKANKAKYRPFLQELGTLIGFNTDTKYVYQALEDVSFTDKPVVFDNPRTEEQAAVLRALGFKIVRMWFPDRQVQANRAYELGVDMSEFHRQRSHWVESGIREYDIALDASKPVEYNAGVLIETLKLERDNP